MKRITYLLSFVFLISLFSCEEEDYKNMNITNPEEEVDIKELVGDLTSHIVITNLSGESITEVDMGETFYVIDNTEGGSNGRSWTITQGSTTITSEEQLVRVNLTSPGKATISLTSTRASDGKSVTSEAEININFIPVTASFSSPAENGGIVTILEGESVAFTTEVGGAPTLFEWKFEGPVTLTSEEQNPTVRFDQNGSYKVTFAAKRDDGDAGITEAVVEKTAYIVVDELFVNYINASIIDNILTINYSKPVARAMPVDAADQYSITINTAAGNTITPDITEVTSSGNTIMVKFAEKMYSDDQVFVTFTPSGSILDATGLKTLGAIAEEPCLYGKNLLEGGGCDDASQWKSSSNANSNKGSWEIASDDTYQGAGAIHMTNTPGGTQALIHKAPFKLEKGVEYTVRAMTKKLGGQNNNVNYVRFSTESNGAAFMNDKANGMNQLWQQINNYGQGEWKEFNWMAGKGWAVNNNMVYNGSLDTDEVYLYFLMTDQGGTDADVLIDYVQVFPVEPRP